MNYLRYRWSQFCNNVKGVFKLSITSYSNTGVWIENMYKQTEQTEQEIPANVIPSTNSLLSNRMKDLDSPSGNLDVRRIV